MCIHVHKYNVLMHYVSIYIYIRTRETFTNSLLLPTGNYVGQTDFQTVPV